MCPACGLYTITFRRKNKRGQKKLPRVRVLHHACEYVSSKYKEVCDSCVVVFGFRSYVYYSERLN